jgi:hypothetical protein
MFSVIALVAWAIIGLPLFYSSPWSRYEPAQPQAYAQAANRNTQQGEPWLTKDAAGFFTFLLVGVGAAQLWLFVWQLRLFRESLDDAKIAADAAKEAADAGKIQAETAQLHAETARQTLQTMQDTAERQLRAYVFAEPGGPLERQMVGIPSTGVGAQPYGGIAAMQRHIFFEVKFTNSGQTPAYRFRQSTVSEIMDEPVAEENFLFEPEHPISRATLPAGAVVTSTGSVPYTAQDEADIRAGRKTFYVFGEIEYVDAFKQQRRVRFRLMHGQHTRINDLVYAETGNEEIEEH